MWTRCCSSAVAAQRARAVRACHRGARVGRPPTSPFFHVAETWPGRDAARDGRCRGRHRDRSRRWPRARPEIGRGPRRARRHAAPRRPLRRGHGRLRQGGRRSSPSLRRAHWVVYFSRGITHEREDHWPEAEADFRKALELQPDQPQVLNYLGYSHGRDERQPRRGAGDDRARGRGRARRRATSSTASAGCSTGWAATTRR